MKNILYIAFAFGALSIISCKDAAKKHEPEVVTVDNTEEKVKVYKLSDAQPEFKDQKVAEVFNAYLQVEAALVNTDVKSTAEATKHLNKTLQDAEATNEAIAAAQAIDDATTIEEQRTQFVIVTAQIEQMVEGALASGTIYKQYCPMAFNNTGAYWLSNSDQVLNPYFGDKMLKCGRVDAKIE